MLNKVRPEDLYKLFKSKKVEETLEDLLKEKEEDYYLTSIEINSKINHVLLTIKDKIDIFFYKLKLCEHQYKDIGSGLAKCEKCEKVVKKQNPRVVFIKKILKRKDGINTFFNRVRKQLCNHNYTVISISKDGKTEVSECTNCGRVILKEIR